MKSRQRVLPDSLFIHSSSITLSFAWSFSRSSGNAVVACSKISSSILRGVSTRTSGRRGRAVALLGELQVARVHLFEQVPVGLQAREEEGGMVKTCAPCRRATEMNGSPARVRPPSPRISMRQKINSHPQTPSHAPPTHCFSICSSAGGHSVLSPRPGVSDSVRRGAPRRDSARCSRRTGSPFLLCVCGRW